MAYGNAAGSPGSIKSEGGSDAKPARTQISSFGADEELVRELPPNWTLRRFQEEVRKVVADYFQALTVTQAASQVQALLKDCPSEADELGALAIRAALDRGEAAQKPMVDLLCKLTSVQAIDSPALVRSFEKLFCTWEDIAIDVPRAPEALIRILRGCVDGGVADRALVSKLPENLLNAALRGADPELSDLLADLTGELKAFKQHAARALEEYFVALNTDEVATCLEELGSGRYHYEIVKKAVTLSFSQTDEEAARGAVVTLLSELSSRGLLTKDDLQWGVTRVLGQLDDLELDCPRCPDLTVELLSRLVSDELVSVPFLRWCRCLRIGGATGLKVLDDTQRRTPEYSKKYMGTAQFKREIQTMILEYFNSGDKEEFGRCVREIAPLQPEQNAELIRKIMVLAMERTGQMCEMALELLVWLCRHEELDEDALERGFDDLYTRMPDLLLDVPDAHEMSRAFVVEAKKAKVLRREWPDPAEE
mmetsp:Transcript_50158/g.135004  ORF Transcript_50158/g.135004 Transcript_50158/m.135004 type:complete len:480 (+) Transcript_50158:124-1563(+)